MPTLTRLAVCLAIVLAAHTAPATAGRLALSTLEGEVASIQRVAGEDEGELLAVELRTPGREETTLVLLAPEASCREIGFEVEEGDRLRARVFVPEEGATTAHKVLNLSRGTMVRLRTLRNVPLWTVSGAWQGGPSRPQPGSANAPRHRHSGPGGPGSGAGARGG